MTNEEMNAAIAEWMCHPKAIKMTNGLATVSLPPSSPDYCNDLNAMHEAEKRFSIQEWGAYIDTLHDLDTDPHICQLTRAIAHISATADRRAEALLRTIGKWRE